MIVRDMIEKLQRVDENLEIITDRGDDVTDLQVEEGALYDTPGGEVVVLEIDD